MSSGLHPMRNSKRMTGITPLQAKNGFAHSSSKSMSQLPIRKIETLAGVKLPPLGKMKTNSGVVASVKTLVSPKRKTGMVSPVSLLSGQLSINDFRLMRVIGTGTFSRVRLAQCRDSQEFVAVKTMRKTDIVNMKQVDHVKNEKSLLVRLAHPFIVNLRHSFQDRVNLYLVFDYVSGGELFRLLRSRGQFPPSVLRFYASEVASVISYLHENSVVYRDLKPENVLITELGHVKLTDFGFAKRLDKGERAYTLCGTPEYLAPEIIQQRGHSFPCDWWGFGILIYEMACGHAPFLDKNPFKLYEKIINTEVAFPPGFDPVLRELVEMMLDKDAGTRADQRHIMEHQFFTGVDWSKVALRGENPPYVPTVRAPDDTTNFDEYPDEAPLRQTLLIEDDSSMDSSGTGGFPATVGGRKGTPITRGGKQGTPVERPLRQDFSFREADEEQRSLRDEEIEVEDDADSLTFIAKTEFVKKQPRRLYSKSKDTTPVSTLRARSTISESMRKSSLRKPPSDRTGSLVTPRGQSIVGRKFLQPPRAKLLKPLPIIPVKAIGSSEQSPRVKSKSYRLKRYHRMLEDALRAKAMGKGPVRPPTPKPWTKARDESSVKDHSFDSNLPLRKQFQTSFPVSERKIPSYDASKDKHVKLTTFYARRSLRSQIQQNEVVPMPKRAVVRFQDEITQIDQPLVPIDYKDKKDLYLPKILPQPSDRPSSAPHSQEVFSQQSVLRRDQHSVPRSRGDDLPQERDWGKSILDTMVTQSVVEFNAERDPTVFMEDEVGELLGEVGKRSISLTEVRTIIAKGQATLTRLHGELLLPMPVLQAPPISKDGLHALLLQCRSQLQLRAVIVSTLASIHRREDLLLSLMTLGDDAGSDFTAMYKEVMALSKDILARITQLKNLTQDNEKFVYMDSDYAEKIHEDSSNMMSTFRHLIGGQRDYLNAAITQEDLKGRGEGL